MTRIFRLNCFLRRTKPWHMASTEDMAVWLAFPGGRPQFSERCSNNDQGESSCESIAD
jgi:hypothetical protein